MSNLADWMAEVVRNKENEKRGTGRTTRMVSTLRQSSVVLCSTVDRQRFIHDQISERRGYEFAEGVDLFVAGPPGDEIPRAMQERHRPRYLYIDPSCFHLMLERRLTDFSHTLRSWGYPF